MKYKLKKAEIHFDSSGKLERIRTIAQMPDNPTDVRTIEVKAKDWRFTQFFGAWEASIQHVLQQTTAIGDEI